MTVFSCSAKISVTIRLVFWYESGGDALHTQNMNHNVLSRFIRDVESPCYLSNANTTIFEHNFLHFFDVIVVNRGGWTTRIRQISTTSRPSLNALCHSNTCVLDRVDSAKYFCNIFNDSVSVIPFKLNTKFQAKSLFNSFSIVKIARQTFCVVNQWLPNTH